MAMEILPVTSGGSFLDSQVFSTKGRTNVPPSGFDTSVHRTPIASLDFDTTNEDDLHSLTTPFLSNRHSLDATPDSGISGLAGGSPRSKSPDLDVTGYSCMTRSSSTGSGNGIPNGTSRKRKTVTIDESQTSVVMISPDDLFNTYSKVQRPSSPSGYEQVYHRHCSHDDGHNDNDDDGEEEEEEEDDEDKYYWETDPMLSLREEDPSIPYRVDSFTGWPLKRSLSLESRDNPFLPGGDLCKEAEDLLSKATIIRDNFYLNEEEKRELQLLQDEQREAEEQLLQQKRASGGTKHVQIVDHHDGRIYSTDPSSSSRPRDGDVEERISPQSMSNSFATAPVPSGGDSTNHSGENGKSSSDHNTNNTSSSPDSVKLAIPEGEGQSLPLNGDSLPDKKRRNKCCAVM